jgi:hypothetical protein
MFEKFKDNYGGKEMNLNSADWTIILGIGIVCVPLMIIGLVILWRDRQMKKIGK